MKIILYIGLALLILIPRLIEFNALHHFFGVEQANELLVTKELVLHKNVPLVGPFALVEGAGIYRSPLWSALLAIPFAFGEGNPIAFKSFILISSCLLLFFSFFLFKKLFGISIAIIFITLCAISPLLIELSVKFWPPNIVPFLIPLYIGFLCLLVSGKKGYAIPLGIIFALIAHFEYAVAGRHLLILSPLLAYSVKTKKIQIKSVLLLVGVFLLSFSSLILFYSQQNLVEIVTRLPENFEKIKYSAKFHEYFAPFIWNFRSTFTAHVFLSFALAFFLIVASMHFMRKAYLKKSERLVILYTAVLVAITLGIAIVLRGNTPGWWYYDLPVFYYLIFAILMSKFIEWKYGKLTIYTIILLLFLLQSRNIYKKASTMQAGPSIYSQIPTLIPIDFIYRQENKDFSVVIHSENSNINDYKYLFWWRGYTIHNFYPKFSDEKVYYVITDKHLADSKEGEFLTLQKNETLLFRKTLENRFIVDKREKLPIEKED